MTSPLAHALEPRHLAAEARRVTRKLWRRATRRDQRVARLRPASAPRGAVLLSYILEPLLDRSRAPDHSHTHFWESRTIASTFVDLGFEVDVISWTNHRFVPERAYDICLDPRLNLERLAPLLGGQTVKVLHTDTAHHTVHNPAQERRYQALHARRGGVLRPQRRLEANRAAEVADVICTLGNDWTRASYAFAGKPLVRIPVSVPCTYDWPRAKDWHAVRRRFLWFGSGGLVHKGLDLVLEAFAGLPEYHLTVCGPIRAERDFERLYFRELYQTSNIDTRGFVDVQSPAFLDLASRTLGLVYPSCSEGGGASALTCMHTGLIPVLTVESSVDIAPERGVLLEQASVPAIRRAVAELAQRPAPELATTARAAWEWVRAHHHRARFAECYREFAERLVRDGPGGVVPLERGRAPEAHRR